ncbi:CAP domain-containing protein [Frisingicoccus sp.]|uniref:CAP domain-containing protein n=1 Tax=Frisingicoccus sp. TaxID=1918627 RepID=UPI003AB8A885
MKFIKKRLLAGALIFTLSLSVLSQNAAALESSEESMTEESVIQENTEFFSDEGLESTEPESESEEAITAETESENETAQETEIQESQAQEADSEGIAETTESAVEETESAEETQKEVETGSAAPAPVTDLKAVRAGKSMVKLSWTPSDGADSYIIYRQVGKGKSSYLYITKNSTYVDTKASGIDYNFYWVYPCYTNSSGQRIVGTCPKYVFAKAGLAAAANVKAQAAGRNRVKLTWNSVSGAEGYIIYRQVGKGTYKYRGMTSNTSYLDTTASDADYNFYWVYPYYKENGQNVANTAAKYVYAKGGLAAVSNLTAKVSGKSVKLSWSPVAGAEGYAIYRQIGKGKFQYVYMTEKLSYVDSKCSGNEYNFYRVYACYKDNGKVVVGAPGNYVYSKPGISAVAKITAEATGSKEITITWSKVTGADGYVVFRAGSDGNNVEIIGDTTGSNATTYIDYSPLTSDLNVYAIVPYFIDGQGEEAPNVNIKVVADAYALVGDFVKERITGYESYSEAYKVLTLVNKERTSRGLQALSMDQNLMDAAMQRAAETVVLFDHTRPSGYSCFTATSKAFGENIAYGSWPYYGAEGIMDGWMNSEGHRANILGDYTTIGIGCFQYNGVAYWVQLFGIGDCVPASKPSDRTNTRTVLVASELYGVSAASIGGEDETTNTETDISIDLNGADFQETVDELIQEYKF